MTNFLKRMLSLVMAMMMALSVVPVTAVAEGMILPVPVAIVQDTLPEEEMGEESAQTKDDSDESPAEEAISEEIAPLADSDVVAEGTCGGEGDGTNLSWTLTDEGTLIISGSGAMANYVLSNGSYGTSSAPWYQYKEDITALVLEDGITTIGDYAFTGYTAMLGTLSIPQGVTYIGKSAFYNCKKLTGTLVLPEGLVTIGDSAFSNCTSISGTLVIPNSVKTIGNYAFEVCTKLTGLDLGTGVVTIGDYAFYNCTKLAGSLVIPESVTSIGKLAFCHCSSFTGNLVIPESVTDLGGYVFSGCSGFTGDLTIPESITAIGDFTFSQCSGLNGKLTVPDCVTEIGEYAFYQCSSIKELDLGDGATLGKMAFYKCTSLPASITLGSATTSVGEGAFDGCTTLANIHFKGAAPAVTAASATYPSFPTTAVLHYFYDQTGWETPTWNGYTTQAEVNSVATGYCGGDGNGTNLMWALTADGTLRIHGSGSMKNYEDVSNTPWYSYKDQIKSVVIGNGVTTVGNFAFYYFDSISGSIDLPNSITAIGTSAFGRCLGITAVNLGTGLKTIGNFAFVGTSITQLSLPDGLTHIGDYAFDTTNITGHLKLPNSITSLGRGPFAYCRSITGVTLSTGLTTIPYDAFCGCSGLQGTLEIPEGVTAIENYAFFGSGLKTVNLPSTLTQVGSWAFTGASLEKFVFAGNAPETVVAAAASYPSFPASSVLYFHEGAEGWTTPTWNGYTTKVIYPTVASGYCGGEGDGKNLTWVLTSDGTLTVSGSGAMADYAGGASTPWYSYANSITAVVFEEGVTSVGKYAFNNYKNILSVDFGGTVKTIGDYSFGLCSGISGSVKIPNSVETIGVSAFDTCSGITALSFGTGLKTIDAFAFIGCSGITGELTIPDCVTEINGSAFFGCRNIAKASIGSGIETVDQKAFGNCYGLKEIYFEGSAPAVTEASSSYASFRSSVTLYYYGGQTGWSTPTWMGYNTVKIPVIVSQGTCGSGANSGAISWTVDSEGVLTITGSGAMADYVPITKDAPWADYADQIKSVTIGSGITHVGSNAFRGLTGITEIILPESVTSMGESAFSGCTALKRVTILGDMTGLPNSAFYGCTALESVTLPNSITAIGGSCFVKCKSLQSIDLPDNLEEIGDGAFIASGLTTITIPASVTAIGQKAFSGCEALAEVIFEGNAPSVYPADDRASFPADALLKFKCGTTGWTEPTWNGYNTLSYGHIEVDTAPIPPTCTEVGWKDGKHCEVCGKVFAAPQEVPATDHSYGDWLPVVPPEAETEGHRKQCANCSASTPVEEHLDDNADTLCDLCGFDMPLPVASISLSHGYILLQAGESTQLSVTVDPAAMANRVEWSIAEQDAAIASVDQNGLLTANGKGTTLVYARVTDADGIAHEARCRVDVTEGPVEETVVKAHIGTATVTSSVYSTKYPTFEVIFDLPQNGEGQTAGNAQNKNNGVAITSARFTDSIMAELFGIQVLDDRTLQVVPKFDVMDDAAVKALKSSYKSEVCLMIADGTVAVFTPEKLTVKVDKKLPSVKAASVKVNTFYQDATMPLTFTCKAGEVIGAVVNHEKSTEKTPACPAWLTLNEDLSVTVAGQGGKYSGKLQLLATVEDYVKPVPVSVSVSASVAKPAVKLNKTSVTLLSVTTLSNGAELSLVSANKKLSFDALDVTALELVPVAEMAEKEQTTYEANNHYDIPDYDSATGAFLLKAKQEVLSEEDGVITYAPAVGGKLLLRATLGGVESQTVTLPLTVKVHTKMPTLKLAKTSVTLNTDLRTAAGEGLDPVEVGITANPADFDCTDLVWKVYDSKTKADLTDRNVLDIRRTESGIAVNATAYTDFGQTYKVEVNTRSIIGVKPVTLTVKTLAAEKGDMTLTLSAKGTLDTSRLENSSIVLTPKYKNFNALGESEVFFTFTATNTKTQESTVVNEAFLTLKQDDGTYLVKTAPGCYLDPSLKYTVVMTALVGGNDAVSKETKLTVKQGSIKVAQSTKTVTLYRKDRFSEGYIALSVADQTVMPVVKVDLKDAEKSFFDLYQLADGSYAIGFKDNLIAPKAKNGSVKLNVWLEGNTTDKPNATVSVSVKILAFK